MLAYGMLLRLMTSFAESLYLPPVWRLFAWYSRCSHHNLYSVNAVWLT